MIDGIYTFLMGMNKVLKCTNKVGLYRNESFVDKIQFYVLANHDEYDLRKFTCMLKYLDQDNVAHAEILEPSPELYKDAYIIYTLPIDSQLNQFPGEINLCLSFTLPDLMHGTYHVLHSTEAKIMIEAKIPEIGVNKNKYPTLVVQGEKMSSIVTIQYQDVQRARNIELKPDMNTWTERGILTKFPIYKFGTWKASINTPGILSDRVEYIDIKSVDNYYCDLRKPEEIVITQMPAKTLYMKNEALDLSGLEVTIRYAGGTTEVFTDKIETDTLLFDRNHVKVGVRYGDELFYTYLTLNETPISSLRVVEYPKLNYRYDEVFDERGVVLECTYINGQKRLAENTEFVCSESSDNVLVTFTSELSPQTLQTNFMIHHYNLLDIEIVAPPDKDEYNVGDILDPTGMIVEAQYDMGIRYDGTTPIYDVPDNHIVTTYTYDNSPLQPGITQIAIQYTENTITQTAYVTVHTTVQVIGITIQHAANKTSFIEDDLFTSAGLQVAALFDDGTSAIIIPTLSIAEGTPLIVGNSTSVVVSYMGFTKTYTIKITRRDLGIHVVPELSNLTFIPSARIEIDDNIYLAHEYKSGGKITRTRLSPLKYYSSGKYNTYLLMPSNSDSPNVTVNVTYFGDDPTGVKYPVTLYHPTVDHIEPTATTYSFDGDVYNETAAVTIVYTTGETYKTSNYTCNLNNKKLTVDDPDAVEQTYQVKYTFSSYYFDSDSLTLDGHQHIVQRKPVALKITKPSTRTYYARGESFSPYGLEVSAVYNTGATKVIPYGGLQGYSATISSSGYVTIKYSNLSTSFDIEYINIPDITEGSEISQAAFQKVVDAYYDKKVSASLIAKYWIVGSNFKLMGGQSGQTITDWLRLLDIEKDYLETPINDRSRALLTLTTQYLDGTKSALWSDKSTSYEWNNALPISEKLYTHLYHDDNPQSLTLISYQTQDMVKAVWKDDSTRCSPTASRTKYAMRFWMVGTDEMMTGAYRDYAGMTSNKFKTMFGTSSQAYWTRTPTLNRDNYAEYIANTGVIYSSAVTTERYILWGFCI